MDSLTTCNQMRALLEQMCWVKDYTYSGHIRSENITSLPLKAADLVSCEGMRGHKCASIMCCLWHRVTVFPALRVYLWCNCSASDDIL